MGGPDLLRRQLFRGSSTGADASGNQGRERFEETVQVDAHDHAADIEDDGFGWRGALGAAVLLGRHDRRRLAVWHVGSQRA
jgi:hypothetical protein